MDPITAPPAATVTPTVSTATTRPVLPRPVFWTALVIAAALPVILLVTLVIVMVATQYNFLNWME